MSLNHQKRAVGLRLILLSLPFLLLSGCGGYGNHAVEEREKKPMNPEEAKAVDAPLDSANGYLAIADLDKFQPGRSKSDILKDLHWRGDDVQIADCNGRAICAITYELRSDEQPGVESPISVHAIFVDNKFVKFIPWLPGEIEEVPYGGTTLRRPKPVRVDDCRWLSQAMETEPVSTEDLRKEVRSASASPKRNRISSCQIVAWLMLGPSHPATEDDYRRNAALRDQFNAARLDIGMTESQVESILKAKPLEQGKVDSGLYKIYGSNQAFNIVGCHFPNVLVLFREGKATIVCSFCAGNEWRRNLGEALIDLP